nr:MAG TPA: hypothetical protein [Bacteriophage sp.]
MINYVLVNQEVGRCGAKHIPPIFQDFTLQYLSYHHKYITVFTD